jgi:type II secretory pathway component GspD/PulD (secretin)
VKSKTFFISWALFACLVLSSPSAFCADVHENTSYSLQFKSVSISDALKQIAETTGIKIITPKQLGDQVITKSYKNQTIERILKDMFRDMNFALVWSYGEKGIDSVKIVALEKGSAAGARYSPEAARPTIRDYRAARPPAQRQAPPKRGLSPPRRSTVDTEPEDTEQEVSAEQEELEGDQEEAEPEEEGKEAMSSSEESDEEAPSGTERKRRP